MPEPLPNPHVDLNNARNLPRQKPLDIPLQDREYQSDLSRAAFLADLDDADHIDLSEFETDFVGSNLSREEFTPRQRVVIDKMREKYGSRL